MSILRNALRSLATPALQAVRAAQRQTPALISLAKAEHRELRRDLRLRMPRTAGLTPAYDRDRALHEAIGWLYRSVDAGSDAGSRCYWLGTGWSPCYPEVTGYNAISLFEHARAFGIARSREYALRMCDWLLTVQQSSGGFQGGYIGLRSPEPIVFNSAQILHGLIRAYTETGNERFRGAAIRAGDWLVSMQDTDGAWRRSAYLGVHRTTDTLIALPLAKLWQVTGDERYRDSAVRSFRNAMTFQTRSGWFGNTDNSVSLADQPVTHTLAYTIEGLLEGGQLLELPDVFASGRHGADAMLEVVAKDGILWGRYFDGWAPAVRYACLTGCAQTARNWLLLHVATGEDRYLRAAVRMNDQLCEVQHVDSDNPRYRGAIAGSSPIQGEYMQYKFPSWATKYFCDSLIRERKSLELHHGK